MSRVHALVVTSVILGGALAAAEGWSAPCRSGGQVRLRQDCATAWRPQSNGFFYRWTDDPSLILGKAPLERTACGSLSIAEVREQDRLARVRCASGPVEGDLWINLDYLSCGTPPRSNGEVADCCSAAPAVASGAPGGAAGRRLLALAEKTFERVRKRAKQDQYAIVRHYDAMEAGAIKAALAGAYGRLVELSKGLSRIYGDDCERIPPNAPGAGSGAGDDSRLVRSMSACVFFKDAVLRAERLAKDAVNGDPRALLRDYSEEGERKLGKESEEYRERSLGAKPAREALVYREAFERHQYDREKTGVPYDLLLLRTILYYGLPEEARASLLKTRATGPVQYIRSCAESGVTGCVTLHNGYVYGGRSDEGGFDCAGFVTALLAGEGRDTPTTYFFRDLSRALLREPGASLPGGPWRKLHQCFRPVRVRDGEAPEPGDIVVSRNDGVNRSGHMVLVTRYHAYSGAIETLESTGGRKATIGHFTRPLREPSCREGTLGPFRADVHVLRLDLRAGCPLRF